MNSKTLKVLGLALLTGPMAAQAVLINYGTSEYVTVRDCRFAGTSGCDGISLPLPGSQYGGLPGAPTSAVTVSVQGYGVASGEVSLSGTIGAPILRAGASSEPGKRLNTNSIALQSYTYTGSAATTRTFGGTLTYSQSLTGDYPSGVGAGVVALIDVFTLPVSVIEVGDTPQTNYDALAFYRGLPGYSSLGLEEYRDRSSNAAGFATLGVTVALNPGDTVWVWTLLQTIATNGSEVDATQTLITGWDNPADLTPAVAVPEPGTLALLGLGLAGLAATRRRKQ